MMDHLARWLLLLLMLLLGLFLWQGKSLRHESATPQRGINFVALKPEQLRLPSVEEDLKHLKSLGVDWIAVVVTWYQGDAQSTKIAPEPQRTPRDEDLVQLLRRLRELGLRAFLRPMVDLRDGTWRGQITFSATADWEAWFQSYRDFITHYAQLAAREQVALFSTGVELEGTVQREREWHSVIASVRRIFRGPLTYSANWDGYSRVLFWDALDYAGIDAYFELALKPDSKPTVDALITAWDPWVRQLDQFAARIGRPILLTEIGTRSVEGAARRPWDWRDETPISLQEQADYYEASFQVFWRRPWLAGFYWWAWLPDPSYGGPGDSTYALRGKPAEAILKAWYMRKPH